MSPDVTRKPIAELRKIAAALELDVPDDARKADLVAMIQAEQGVEPDLVDSLEPDPVVEAALAEIDGDDDFEPLADEPEAPVYHEGPTVEELGLDPADFTVGESWLIVRHHDNFAHWKCPFSGAWQSNTDYCPQSGATRVGDHAIRGT